MQDTGCGIPHEKLGSVFEAFEQADMSTTRKYGGTGLGLHLVKELVKSHHGEIEVGTHYSTEGLHLTLLTCMPCCTHTL